MAIVKMKKLRVMAMAADQERLLHQLQHLGCVEISQPSEELEDTKWASMIEPKESQQVQIRAEMSEAQSALAAVKEYAPKKKEGFFPPRRQVTEEELLRPDTLRAGRRAAGRIHTWLDTLARMDADESRLLSKKNGLTPWLGLNMPMELQESAHVVFRPCVFPTAVDLEGLRTQLSAQELPAELIGISRDRQQRYVLLICHKSAQEDVTNLLRESGFSAVAFPEPSGTPAEAMKGIEEELDYCRRKREETKAELAACGEDKDTLQLYLDHLSAREALTAGDESLLNDGTVTLFEGWCPAENLSQVETLLENLGCAWTATDPTEEEIPQVPVKLRDNFFCRCMNVVTEMYSLPAYNGVDPNPLMAPFFILFFGVMMADMGYGILMIAASLYVLKKSKPREGTRNFMELVFWCGISTTIIGAMTGGFLGDFIPQIAKIINPESTLELPALFTPLNDTVAIMLGSIALGCVQIITGMTISIVRKIQAGNFLDALFDEITWWIILGGVALAIFGIGTVNGIPVVLTIGGLMLVFGGTREAKGFGKVTKLVGLIYNGVTGFFSDALSYVRLMALMLSGSVIASVFNTLGATFGNVVLFVIVSLIGNALNLALNLLGCYVHDLRLQCLEFFNRFYQEGGKPYRPLTIQPKYVDMIKEEQ